MKQIVVIAFLVVIIVIISSILGMEADKKEKEIAALKEDSVLWREAFKSLVWTGKEVVFKPTKVVDTNKDMPFEEFAARALAGAYADQKMRKERPQKVGSVGATKKYFDEGMEMAFKMVPLLKDK